MLLHDPHPSTADCFFSQLHSDGFEKLKWTLSLLGGWLQYIFIVLPHVGGMCSILGTMGWCIYCVT